MALVGLYSGRKIKSTPGKLTRTQTGKQALKAIIKKYGKIVDSAKYKHIGKGNWVKYSIENDKKRTGKVTNDIKEWQSRPHKLDYRGIDTIESNGTKTNKKLTFDEKILDVKKQYGDKYNIKRWIKGNKDRIYVDQSYLTKNENDVFGKNNDFAYGWYIQYDRPGHFSTLKDIAKMLK